MKNLLILLVLSLVAVPVTSQTFPTTTTLPAAIPDGAGVCVAGALLNLTVPVTGVAAATSLSLNFTMAPAHTFYGDIKCVVTAPSGASVPVMVPFCEGSFDDASDVAGPYTLSDTAAQTFDAAAIAAAAIIPPGTYAPDNAMSGLLVCSLNGTWTVTFQDHFNQDVGSVSACSLTFGTGASAESFTICQTGAGAPVNLVHLGGTAGALYINPALLNTPASIPLGWAFGLDIPFAAFIAEMTFPPPFFSGTLDGTGSSVVSVPGLPPALTIQIVAVHFSPTTGLPTFASSPVSYTVI